MRIVVSNKAISILGASLFIVGLPLVVLLAWTVVDYVWEDPDKTLFLLLSQAMVAMVVVVWYLVKSMSKPKISSAKENELMASLAQFKSLYKHSPVPYLTIDGKDLIKSHNLAATRLFRTTIDDLKDTDIVNYLTLEDENELSVLLGKIETGYSFTDEEVQLRARDGALLWVSLSMFSGSSKGTRLVSMVDITRKKMIDIAKTEFVSLATHQLRTPVAAIRWNLDLMRKGLEKASDIEKLFGYLDRVERNSIRMTTLIDDFLNVSKLETGTFATSSEMIELSNFFQSVVEEYTGSVEEKKINLKRSEQPSKLSLLADKRLLHIIVSNLLSNAVKYVPESGVVVLQYELKDKEVVITVADSGIGIPVDQLDNLFTKFFRARNAERQATEGTGLGLYVVKQSVEKLGGTIAVSSVEGQGTTFEVRLLYISMED